MSPPSVTSHLLSLMKDDERYADLLWRAGHLQYHEHGLRDAWCQLCYKAVHRDRYHKSYPDIHQWFTQGKCWDPK